MIDEHALFECSICNHDWRLGMARRMYNGEYYSQQHDGAGHSDVPVLLPIRCVEVSFAVYPCLPTLVNFQLDGA